MFDDSDRPLEPGATPFETLHDAISERGICAG